MLFGKHNGKISLVRQYQKHVFGIAEISLDEQQSQIIHATLDFLRSSRLKPSFRKTGNGIIPPGVKVK